MKSPPGPALHCREHVGQGGQQQSKPDHRESEIEMVAVHRVSRLSLQTNFLDLDHARQFLAHVRVVVRVSLASNSLILST